MSANIKIGHLGEFSTREVFVGREEPVLFTCQNQDGEIYMVLRTVQEHMKKKKGTLPKLEKEITWLYAYISKARLDSARNGKVSLRDIYTRPEKGYIWRVKESKKGLITNIIFADEIKAHERKDIQKEIHFPKCTAKYEEEKIQSEDTQKSRQSETSCITDLANAIVVQAANEYREHKAVLEEEPSNELSTIEAASIEKFFHSEWFGALTGINPEALIKKLKEANDEAKPNTRTDKELSNNKRTIKREAI